MQREARDAAVFNGGSVRIDDVLPAGPNAPSTTSCASPAFRRQGGGGHPGRRPVTRVLDAGVHNQGLGGYLHSAGITWENGVWQVGEPADPAGRYRVALTDFLLSGGEVNLGFLTATTAGARCGRVRDIRRVLIEELASAWPKPAKP